jgi:flagellar M-ring protein FliF
VARLAAMGVVSLLTLGLIGFLVLRATSPQLAPLYSGLSLEDSAAIVKQLQSMNAEFALRGDGDTILVPRDQITTLRMQLAGNGLPSHGQVGYEIFDQQSTLGATSFVQNINNVRALEGELARTITAINRIKSARVHLVLPERQLFQKQAQQPSASIMLSVQGQLSASEVTAIQHLVAAAVEGLTPNRVSIVDDRGELLAGGAEGDPATVLATDAQQRRLAIEDRMRTRLEDMLNNVLGAGRARVEVSAELDLSRSSSTSEAYDPNSQVVRSTQTRDIKNSSSEPGTSGAVSVANNLPSATQNATPPGTSAQQGSTTEETTNYEISKTTTTSVSDPGSIKKLSVAVVVDGTYADDGKGSLTYSPRTQAQLDQIKTLVQSAVGFDQARGDQVDVVNMQFAEHPLANVPGTSAPGLFDFTRDDLMNWAQMGVTLLIALALIVFIMRPLLKRALSPEAPPLALPQTAELAPGTTLTANGEMLPPEETGTDPDNLELPAWVHDAKSMGESQLRTLKTVGELVEENPKQAALIVRDWLNNAA